ITPGTLTDTAYLEGAANNFLLAVSAGRDSTGVALVDVSTGEFWAGEDTRKAPAILAAALLRRPAELLLPDTARADPAFLARLQATGAALTFCDPGTFAPRRASTDLCAHFRVDSLAAFGVGDLTAGLGAAAAALAYLRATQGDALGHLTRRQRLTAADAMVLDETAVVTLELLTSSGGSARESLFGVLDETVTPMGARLLRQWLLRPLLDPPAIAARQAAVGALVEAPAERARLATWLRRIGDLQRPTSRPTLRQAHARRPGGLPASLARGARAGANRDLESAGALQSGVRLRHRGDSRPGLARARRVRAPPDADRCRALRDPGAQGIRGEGARRRRAATPARIRAVR